jgi:hypothetical protein
MMIKLHVSTFFSHLQEKGPYLNTLEKFRIYRTQQTAYLLNDIHANTYNPIFELLIDHTNPGSRPLSSSVHVCHPWFPLQSELGPSSLAVLYNPHSLVPVYSGYISSITVVSMCSTSNICRLSAYCK